MKRGDTDRAFAAFSGRRGVTLEELSKDLRTELLHELVFYRHGAKVIEQCEKVKFYLKRRESDVLLRVGPLEDSLCSSLRERLKYTKLRLGRMSLFRLKQFFKDQQVEGRIWTHHLQDRIQALIALAEGRGYDRTTPGAVSNAVLEMAGLPDLNSDLENVIPQAEIVPEGYEMVAAEESDEVETCYQVPIAPKTGIRIPSVVIDLDVVSQVPLTTPEVSGVVQVLGSVGVGESKNSEKNLAVKVFQIPPPVPQVPLAPQVIVEKCPFVFAGKPTMVDQLRMAISVAGTIVRYDPNENIAYRIYHMIKDGSVKQQNDALRDIWLSNKRTGWVPTSESQVQGLYRCYHLAEYESCKVDWPLDKVRKRSLDKLGYSDWYHLVVDYDFRLSGDKYNRSKKELQTCLMMVGYPSAPAMLVMSGYTTQFVFATNNPLLMNMGRDSLCKEPMRRDCDIGRLAIDARRRTWGPVPIALFVVVDRLPVLQQRIDLDKEIYFAYQYRVASSEYGSGKTEPPLLRLNFGLPGFSRAMSHISDTPIVRVSGSRAAYKVGDPAFGLLDDSWTVFRIPSFDKLGIESPQKMLWITLGDFDYFHASCRPIFFNCGKKNLMSVMEFQR